ncbi:glycosyltransferase family 2 protein [Flavobacterium soli]|uniref:glycosyltransferase family 2 protein n=1 Tax=Flavobacterium soli TaxID=344881 RepID=UPI0004282DB8|nr:glycosyltransferase family 2 protein [Flavobacterium soli]
MVTPKVSIIIPTYNRAEIITATLKSVKEQTFEDWECIIVDDGSSDDTAKVVNVFVNGDKRFFYFPRPSNFLKGPSSCRNIGISKAKGQFIQFLDSDDLLASYCLEKRLGLSIKMPHFDLYIFKTQIFYGNIKNLGPIFNLILDDYSEKKYLDLFIKDNYPFCVMSVLWVTEKIRSIGGFDENLQVLEDPDLHINAFLKGLQSFTETECLPDSFYRKEINKSSPTLDDKLKHIRSKLFFYKKYLPLFKKEIGNLPLTFFRVHVLDYGSFFDLYRYYWVFLQNNIFSIRQAISVPILLLYKLLRLDKIRGLGFYKLSLILIKK